MPRREKGKSRTLSACRSQACGPCSRPSGAAGYGEIRGECRERPAVRPRRASPRRGLPTTRTGSTEIIRFGDLDPQGHVNQAVFLTYFESGRVAMFRDPDLGIGVPGATFVMVRMEVDYLKELHWPGTHRDRHRRRRVRPLLVQGRAGDLPRRRLRRHRPRHAGLHRPCDAQGARRCRRRRSRG